jgi:FkbM family methyltransferase
MITSFKKYIKRFLFPDLKFVLHQYPGRLEKLGTSYYGGWIIPTDKLNADSICYLAGAGEDISFDISLAKKFKCRVYIYDPTPRAKKHFEEVVKAAHSGNKLYIGNSTEYYDTDADSIKLLKFETLGLWKQSGTLKFFAPKDKTHVSHSISNLQQTDGYFLAEVQRLSEIMKQNNHQYLDILKLDIEGAEFEVIESILEDNIPIKILCVEFHKHGNQLGQIQSCLEKLEANNYRVVAREEMDFTFINRLHD